MKADKTNPHRWPLDKKLAYVRKRLAADDAMGRHPLKRLSLWPLSLPEALGVIFSNAKPPQISDEDKAWQKGKENLSQLRKHLQQPNSRTRE